MSKKILFISRHAPYGRSLAKEALDALLAASAYGQDISLLFMNDGVLQLKQGQDSDPLAAKNISATLPILPMYDIEKIYVQKSALQQRGLNREQLVMETIALSDQDITQLMEAQDSILSF